MNLQIVDNIEKLRSVCHVLKALPKFAFDTETTGLDWTRNEIFLLSFSDGVTSWVVPTNRFEKDKLALFLKECFKNPQQKIIGQNLKFDAHHLMKTFGVTIEGDWHDTQLMAYLMDENRLNSLKKLMPDLLGIQPEDETKIHAWMEEHQGKRENWDFSKVPEELMFPYSGMDPFATFKLYEKLLPEVTIHFDDLYNTDRQVLKILWKLEQNGVRVDRTMLEMFQVSTNSERDELAQRIFKEAGREFELTVDEDLRKYFYEELKLPVIYKTEKDGLPAVNDDALTAMGHPVAEMIQDWRGTTNLLNYAKGLLEKQDSNGLVHGDYSITKTKTGRFSCSEPNLQNVPKNTVLRKCFVADEGYDMFYFDHAQIEMVGFAHYSQDPKMMAALKAGQDLHKLAASEVYGIPIDQVDKAQRAVGKGTNFSIIYGVGKKKLASYINGYMGDGKKLTSAEAQQFKDRYFQRFPSVPRFQYQAQNAVRTKRHPWGYFIKNQFGRVRRIPNPIDTVVDGKMIKGKAYTAVNHLIQGWAPDLMKHGMVKIEKLLQPRWRQNVHDELRIDPESSQTPAQRKEWVHEIVKALTTFPEVRVPVACKVEWSDKSWADLQNYEEK